MNPTLFISAATRTWLDCVTVNWRRRSSVLWRVPEGAIHAAYSAESFPRVAVFTHEGRLFTNCGVHYQRASSCRGKLLSPEESMPRTQQEMRRLLERRATSAGAGGQPKQIDLTL
jgi:hypothetical protein